MFGLPHTNAATVAHDTLPELYNHAGNLEKSLEGVAEREPRTLLTPEQIRTYNSVVERATAFLPTSVVLKEDAPLIAYGAMPQAQTVYRILHTAIVPTLHNALTNRDEGGAALPGV